MKANKKHFAKLAFMRYREASSVFEVCTLAYRQDKLKVIFLSSKFRFLLNVKRHNGGNK
jgi:hypothetical protein